MAGDINTGEMLVLGEPPKNAVLPRIIHQYGPRVRIGLTGTEVDSQPIRFGSFNPENLSLTERLGYEAFLTRQSNEYLAEKRDRPFNGQRWDDGDDPPEGAAQLREEDQPPEEGLDSFAPPTSDTLTDTIALGMILVSGPSPALTLKLHEQKKFIIEAQNGLSWMAGQSPAKDVTWVHEVHHVTVGTPDTGYLPVKDREAPWRDPALAMLGYRSGIDGATDYVEDLRRRKGTRWGYCAFFTHYVLRHFAYARIHGPRVVMNYFNRRGPVNIDRLFAHETGHIFGAPDEYPTSKCSCVSRHGPWDVPNGNCELCTADLKLCIMNHNDWAMCRYTPYHLGYNGLPQPFVP